MTVTGLNYRFNEAPPMPWFLACFGLQPDATLEQLEEKMEWYWVSERTTGKPITTQILQAYDLAKFWIEQRKYGPLKATSL